MWPKDVPKDVPKDMSIVQNRTEWLNKDSPKTWTKRRESGDKSKTTGIQTEAKVQD